MHPANLATTTSGGFFMIRFLCIVCLTVIMASCQTTPPKEEPLNNDSKDSVAPFYPFPQYLQDQISYVDTTPFAIIRIVKKDGITIDSGLVEKPAFKEATLPFASIDPNSNALKDKYEESSFQDLSLEAITFMIVARDTTLPLQEATVLLHPETKRVKRVMQKKVISAADSTITQQLLWIHNQRCQIAEIISKKDGTQYTRSISYVWDEPM
jgi:hypothetical protein